VRPHIDTVLEWRGRLVVDRGGEKIGRFEDIYLDAETDLPAWAGVRTGLLGRGQSLVPLSTATPAGDDLRVPFDKELVESAPSLDPEAEPSQADEAALYEHYGLIGSGTGGETEVGEEVRHDNQESTDDAMTRSEEEVEIRPEARPRERVRLKKYVVTEPVTKTVPVRREEIRVERVPVEEDEQHDPESS
jgi:hypothetical protein